MLEPPSLQPGHIASMDIDEEKTAEVALAVLSLTASEYQGETRAWKALDWGIQDRLHTRGWILNPVGKAKSVVLTDEGIVAAERFRELYLASTTQAADVLEELEEGMWRSATRYDEQWMKRHLHPEFLEFGQSGRVYNLESITLFSGEEIVCELPLPNLSITMLSAAAALLTYNSRLRHRDKIQCSHRSSTWLLEAGQWRMRFHQGTPYVNDDE